MIFDKVLTKTGRRAGNSYIKGTLVGSVVQADDNPSVDNKLNLYFATGNGEEVMRIQLSMKEVATFLSVNILEFLIPKRIGDSAQALRD